MSIDYSALEADVAEWVKGHLETVKQYCGEEAVYAEAVRLIDEDPWQALQWYVEDVRRRGE